MPDNISNQVLQIIAQQQRDMHAQNIDINQQTLDAVNGIKDDLHHVQTDIAVYARDLADIRTWRTSTVDPFIVNTKDGIAQARGASRTMKLICTGLGFLGGGALMKVASIVWLAIKTG